MSTRIPFEVNFYYVVSFMVLAFLIFVLCTLIVSSGIGVLTGVLPRGWIVLTIVYIVFRYAGHVRRQLGAR